MGECFFCTLHDVVNYTCRALALFEHAGHFSGKEAAAGEVSVKDRFAQGTGTEGADFFGPPFWQIAW